MLENKLYRMIGGLMKSRKIRIIVASIAVLLSIGGCTVKHKDDTKQGKTIAASSTKVVKEDKEAIKIKQLNYLKEHEQEIVDFVKSQSSKVESVQIYWDETQWIDGGNGTPQGGDEVIEIFGTVNQLEDSGWRVDVVFDSDQKMTFGMGQHISIKGDYIE